MTTRIYTSRMNFLLDGKQKLHYCPSNGIALLEDLDFEVEVEVRVIEAPVPKAPMIRAPRPPGGSGDVSNTRPLSKTIDMNIFINSNASVFGPRRSIMNYEITVRR